MRTPNEATTKTLEKPFVILCEGTDDKNFLDCYFSYLRDNSDPRFKDNIQVNRFDGAEKLSDSLATMKNTEGYENVKRILVIRDADTNINAAIRKVESAFRHNALPVPTVCNQWAGDTPPNTAYTLMPACDVSSKTGALEDLCWDILIRDDLISFKHDVQSFIDEIKSKYNSRGSHEHKSRIHTYFSVNKEFVSMKIGEAARAGAFNWEHEKLEPLKKLIETGL